MELCDRGSLQDAIDQGWLRSRHRPAASPARVAATALEVARGMRELHRAGVLHGDLQGDSVLLSSHGPGASVAGRGFVARVADFGFSRVTRYGEDLLQSNAYGVVGYTAPEVLQTAAAVSKAADVYSFGVLLWSMWTGSRPWAGMTSSAVIDAVARQRRSLVFPEDAPSEIADLGRACMRPDAGSRPSFGAAEAKLAAFLAGLHHNHFEDL
ncbi:Mitogen-activated protein kinase kinase kinase 9 [Monoraphidium neglectum]|uniref:Mitogen-activated protein kinase kinase kinase 9 n=1 Tax=Monoraphidium neglectum TaxID=145388 RepID=A0A0D2KFL0_9CHLO|nr:Mitogen-activated protein kinase kinase kinase 9 [Monoraphidium neglectum]KIY94658.1 Mitogen-activated protein kinase kinase kinase 9 [Monoraphidium neglectum]|eukprot:XP_013893678.1 Mitogen-activated protein kinase kinase kinase 9 [Monoraphidium neglectum]